MKTITAITAVGVAALGFAGQADAFKLSPPNTSFTATGATALTANGITLNCTSTFGGKTSATGTGTITAFSATGQTGCSSIVATLPWHAKATTATNILFTKVAVGIPGLVSCGPGAVNAKDNGTGAVTFKSLLNPGSCHVSGTVQSTPAITIVP